jgi:hypothetical protein
MIVQNRCLILYILGLGDAGAREEVPMDSANHWQSERERRRVQSGREELVERLARAIREDGTAEPLAGKCGPRS